MISRILFQLYSLINNRLWVKIVLSNMSPIPIQFTQIDPQKIESHIWAKSDRILIETLWSISQRMASVHVIFINFPRASIATWNNATKNVRRWPLKMSFRLQFSCFVATLGTVRTVPFSFNFKCQLKFLHFSNVWLQLPAERPASFVSLSF